MSRWLPSQKAIRPDQKSDRQVRNEFLEVTKPEGAQTEGLAILEAERRWGLDAWAYRVKNNDPNKRHTVGHGFTLKGFGRSFEEAFRMADRLDRRIPQEKFSAELGSSPEVTEDLIHAALAAPVEPSFELKKPVEITPKVIVTHTTTSGTNGES